MIEWQQLKPCPFCGCKDRVGVEILRRYDVWIQCKDCLAVGPMAKGQDRETAIRNWNKRASPWIAVTPETMPPVGETFLVWCHCTTEFLARERDRFVFAAGSATEHRKTVEAAASPDAGFVSVSSLLADGSWAKATGEPWVSGEGIGITHWMPLPGKPDP